MATKILISIPAKNESTTIAKVIENAAKETIKATGSTPIILVIDDVSKDDTGKIAKSLGAIVLRQEKSLGLGNAFGRSVEFAIANDIDIMITIDGDGQFDTNDISRLLQPIQEGDADFVTASRFDSDAHTPSIPKIKRIGNKLMSGIINSILKTNYKDVSCGFRIYNKEALLHLNVFGAFTYTQEVFLNLGVKRIRIVEVPINATYFGDRKSRIAGSILKYAIQTSKIIFKSVIQYRPMRLFGFLASLFFIIGAPVVAILGTRYYMTDLISPYKGFAITGIIFLVMSFLSIIAGIILELLSRMQLTIERTMYYARKKS
jgi:glycosyltransferase involved in cell wall biosynthesis